MIEIIKNILNKNQIKFNEIKMPESGFSSAVYFIDDKYVIKLSNIDLKKQKIEKEVIIYENLNFDFMPKYIAYGEYENYKYLIISKINGDSLYSIWHDLDDNERKNIIKQIANFLENFHKTNCSFLSNKFKELNWKEQIFIDFQKIILNLKQINFDTTKLQSFAKKSLKLFKNNNYGLCFNDAHFDNFIYKNGKIYIIDFDRVCYCPIDYELMIFKTMCENPKKFASKSDEHIVYKSDFKNIYKWLKKYYPNLLSIPNIDQRVQIYQYIYLTNQAINYNNKLLIEKLNNKFIKK